MTKFLNISTDNTLGGNSPSDVAVSSQKAIKAYVDSQTGTAPAFANITGQPTDNANLASALNAKADDSDVVHLAGAETITGVKSFNETLQLKNNLSFRSYGSNNSGRLQFRAQPSDNVIRGTVAITDGYTTSGSGYSGFVAQMVARAGSTSSDPFNTMRVSNKGIEYIKEANDGTITGQYTLIDDTGIVPDARLSNNIARTSQIPTVPTNVSAFTNDSGYITSSALSGYVPTSRTVNGKALSSNISLSASDVGALPDSTVIPTVNNATLTIQKNGTTVKTFTANASTDVTANIIVPTKVSDLTNDSGFISGITSSDVTTALGYTPYNSSNPSGYQANVIETVKVNGTALTPASKAVDINVPTNNNQLTNGAGYITSSALSGYQTTSNLVTSVSSSSTDSQYPSAKLFYDTCGDIETLINAL